MKKAYILLFVGLLGCGSRPDFQGKWFSFSDEGDYQELWIGEGRALSYLTKVDKLLVYEYRESGDSLKFKLLDSDFIDSHEFALKLEKMEGEVMVTQFISDTRIDPVKTYFLIDRSSPAIARTLSDNLSFRAEIVAREAGGGQSHEGHNH